MRPLPFTKPAALGTRLLETSGGLRVRQSSWTSAGVTMHADQQSELGNAAAAGNFAAPAKV
jgi:hypothetical protein